MSDSAPIPSPALVTVTPAELFWITAGAWLSGACLLALMPVMLAPRVGPAAGLAVSYVLFFIAWQPIQRLTQRAVGPSAPSFACWPSWPRPPCWPTTCARRCWCWSAPPVAEVVAATWPL